MINPQFLYHYTTIENLALILQSKRIKLSRLDKVNDPREGIASDFGRLSKYIFVSCWSANPEESIAFWNIYTPKAEGIRLKFPFPVIKQTDISTGQIIADNEINKGKFLLMPNLEPITMIEYTDDESTLYPQILGVNTINLGKVGKHKSKIWAFESEYRYILVGLPLEKEIDGNNIDPSNYSNALHNAIDLPVESVFFPIDDNALNNCTITLGPRLNRSHKIIVEALVKTYNPSIKVVSSSLIGKYN